MKAGFYANYRMAGGLRTRFSPKSRINQGLISMAPWINMVLLAIFFIWIDTKYLVQPGRVVELPDVPFHDGTRPLMTATVVAGQTDAGSADVVYFDNVRFILSRAADEARLKVAMAKRSRDHGGADLVIQADRQTDYGTVMQLMEMARGAGIVRVNLASRQVVPATAPAPVGTVRP
jgi:biopolymer transport protein ExbD